MLCNKDKVDIYFRNNMDKNFHNSPYDYQQEILKNSYFTDIKLLDMIILVIPNHSCNQKVLNTCFFLQDDVFSWATNEDIDNLLYYIKNNDFDMLNLETIGIATQNNLLYNNNLKIYNTTSDDFMKTLFWSADDAIFATCKRLTIVHM